MNYSSTIHKLRDVIFVGSTHQEFVDQIARAGDEFNPELSRKLAMDNSWSKISSAMLGQIRETMGTA